MEEGDRREPGSTGVKVEPASIGWLGINGALQDQAVNIVEISAERQGWHGWSGSVFADDCRKAKKTAARSPHEWHAN